MAGSTVYLWPKMPQYKKDDTIYRRLVYRLVVSTVSSTLSHKAQFVRLREYFLQLT